MINPLNAELNPIRHLLALVGARHIVHVSRIRVKAVEFEFSEVIGTLHMVGLQIITLVIHYKEKRKSQCTVKRRDVNTELSTGEVFRFHSLPTLY